MNEVSTPISPKVTTGALAGAVATVIVAVAGLLGMELPAGVAEASGVLFGVLVTTVAAWAKRDPLRDAGQVATTAAAAETGQIDPAS